MGKRKSRPGACDTCGRPVVRPTPGEFYDRRRLRHSYTGEFWASNHKYDENDRLVEVKCNDHRERIDWEMWCE